MAGKYLTVVLESEAYGIGVLKVRPPFTERGIDFATRAAQQQEIVARTKARVLEQAVWALAGALHVDDHERQLERDRVPRLGNRQLRGRGLRSSRLNERVIRLKASDVEAFVEANRVQPGELKHLYPDGADKDEPNNQA